MASNPTLNTQTPAAPHDQKFGWGDLSSVLDRIFHQGNHNFTWKGIKELRFIGINGQPDFSIISGTIDGNVYSDILLNQSLNFHLNGKTYSITDPVNYPTIHSPGSVQWFLYGLAPDGKSCRLNFSNTGLVVTAHDEPDNGADTSINQSPSDLIIKFENNSSVINYLRLNKNGIFLWSQGNMPSNDISVIGCVDHTTGQLGFVESVQSGNVPYKVASSHFSTVTPATNSTIISYPVTASGIYQVSLMVFGSFTGTPFKVTGAFTKGGFTYTKDLFPCGTTSATLSTADQFTYPAFTVYCDAGTNLVLTGTYSSTLNTFNAWAQIYKLFET